jgi:predicted dehydrogenase
MVNQPPVRRDLTRREFIGATAAAGAGLVLATGAKVFGQTPATGSPNGKLNVALIGFGAQGRVLLESLLKIQTIQLVAICDIWEYARTYGQRYLKKLDVNVNAYENFEDLLAKEKDLQAVVVAVPDFWHAPVTNTCLKAGLHVYCEKMMSNTIDGARSMVKTMRETGKLLQIGHQRRSNPRYLFALNRLVKDAKICGRLTAAQAQWNRAVTEDFGWPKHSDLKPEQLAKYGYTDMHQFRNWRWFKGLGGGPLSDLGAHQIDIFNWWLGCTPKSVMASGGLDYYKNHEWYDNAMVIYEFSLPVPGGAAGEVYTARAFYQVQTTTSAGGGYFEYFMGDEGSIKMSENPALSAIYQEARAPQARAEKGETPWNDLIQKNYIRAKAVPSVPSDTAKVDVRETAQLAEFEIPVSFNKPPHMPHLENFFNTILGKAKALNCPGDEAFSSEYVIHKANEAIPAQKMLVIGPGETEAIT